MLDWQWAHCTRGAIALSGTGPMHSGQMNPTRHATTGNDGTGQRYHGRQRSSDMGHAVARVTPRWGKLA